MDTNTFKGICLASQSRQTKSKANFYSFDKSVNKVIFINKLELWMINKQGNSDNVNAYVGLHYAKQQRYTRNSLLINDLNIISN